MTALPDRGHANPRTAAADDGYSVISRYYDAAYRDHPQLAGDAQFYLQLAHEAAGPVLEIGCGTGRVLLEIARAGFPCTGVEASQSMLSTLRAKPFPRSLRLACSPMQSFDLGSDRFSLIYSAFRAFQHLYTTQDQLACLARVRQHLAPRGIFAFDVFNPILARTALTEEPEAEDLRFQLEGEEIVRYTAIRRDHARQLLHVQNRFERRLGEQVLGSESASLDIRYFFRFELEHLLARAGFDEVEFYGDFRRSPLDGRNGFVVVART
jgi:SAM-dependent methyltransferase